MAGSSFSAISTISILTKCETWATTNIMNNKIRTTQLAMERKMIGTTWKDKITNKRVKDQTKLPDALLLLKSAKWKWAGHVVRASDNWANIVTGWTPTGKRKRGRPKTKWVDDIRSLNNWMSSAQDRKKWSDQREAFIQQ